MEVFFPVDLAERDALLQRRFEGAELYGQERIAWDPAGVDDDTWWVAAEVEDHVAKRYEDPDGKYLDYRPFTFPRELLSTLPWRSVEASEVAVARDAEEARIQAARAQARAEALANGRRLGPIE